MCLQMHATDTNGATTDGGVWTLVRGIRIRSMHSRTGIALVTLTHREFDKKQGE